MLKDCNPIMCALLRERILLVMDLTMKDIENNPQAWTFVNPELYKELNRIVNQNLSFDK